MPLLIGLLLALRFPVESTRRGRSSLLGPVASRWVAVDHDVAAVMNWAATLFLENHLVEHLIGVVVLAGGLQSTHHHLLLLVVS